MLQDFLLNPAAYLPPRSSLWLWVGGPILILIIYFLTTRSNPDRKKRLREVDVWRAGIVPDEFERVDNKAAAPYRPDPAKKPAPKKKKGKKTDVAPRVAVIPGGLRGALLAVGGGSQVAHYELVPELAYLSLMEANATAGSDYQTVTAKLEERGPDIDVRPLPRVDGVAIANTGVQFKKDPEFMSLFLVEGPDAKAIGQWLSPPLRRALCAVPTAWLRVSGKTMTVSVFGTLEADQIDALVELADTIFAEHGAEGGPSLFPDADERSAPAKPAPKPAAKAASKPAKKASDAVVQTLAETPASKRRGL
jgi:hypothetical protein